jgi:hypothetical protein
MGSGLLANAIGGAPRNAGRFLIYLPGEGTELGIVDDTLKEPLVFAAPVGFSGKKEIVQTEGGSAEGVGLDDVGTGFEILGVDLLNHLRLGQLKKFEAAFEIFAFAIAKTRSAIILLLQFMALDHRAHSAVEQDDALAKQGFEGMKISRHVG